MLMLSQINLKNKSDSHTLVEYIVYILVYPIINYSLSVLQSGT